MPGDKLEFQKQEPAFLRRLREQHGGPRNNVQIARPKKDRLRTGEDGEDDPVIVDETGEDVAKEEWEERLKREKDGVTGQTGETAGLDGKETPHADGAHAREKQKTAEIGAAKKRKAVKVIAEEELNEGGKATMDSNPESQRKDNTAEKSTNDVRSRPKAAKRKKIALSFDEPE